MQPTPGITMTFDWDEALEGLQRYGEPQTESQKEGVEKKRITAQK